MRKFFTRSAVTMVAVGASLAFAPNYAEAATSALYSDPVYWPLHVQSYVDCTTSNPGCSNHHDFYGVDVIPTGQRNGAPLSQAGVYSMGAGIAHIGNAHGTACGTGTATTMGTWVWVDHGGGVVSRYGHLSKISITDGQHVAAGALLGTIGNTGDSSKLYCDENYLDFQVYNKGMGGTSVPFSTKGVGSPDGDLLGCSTESLQLWPLNLSVGITTIEAMPEKTNVPGSSNDCVSRFSAAALPSAPAVKITSNQHSVQATWTGALPAGADMVRVEVGQYHPTTKAYDAQPKEYWRDVNTSIRKVTEGSLKRHTKYRVRVWFHTKQGWVANSGYQSITTK